MREVWDFELFLGCVVGYTEKGTRRYLKQLVDEGRGEQLE